MSEFIVPMGSLPSISSLSEISPGGEPSVGLNSGIPFADVLQTALDSVAGSDQSSQKSMLELAVGGSDDLHTGAISAVKTSTAVNYATALVGKAIQSYNEILRMQI